MMCFNNNNKMSEFENQSIEQKQDYLRKEIIEKKYDPEEFVNYFQECKHGDDFDLEYVKFEELQEVSLLIHTNPSYR